MVFYCGLMVAFLVDASDRGSRGMEAEWMVFAHNYTTVRKHMIRRTVLNFRIHLINIIYIFMSTPSPKHPSQHNSPQNPQISSVLAP